jgi:hypothetical protein
MIMMHIGAKGWRSRKNSLIKTPYIYENEYVYMYVFKHACIYTYLFDCICVLLHIYMLIYTYFTGIARRRSGENPLIEAPP